MLGNVVIEWYAVLAKVAIRRFPAVDEPRGGWWCLFGRRICSGDEKSEMVYSYVTAR